MCSRVQEWGVQPWQLLMVGDSTEDIETGNAAGTATCLIAGGGNEVAGAATAVHPLGAVPTFAVHSLAELRQRLAARDTSLGYAAYTSGEAGSEGGPSSSSSGGGGGGGSDEIKPLAGAPPEGLDFLDWLFLCGALNAAQCSFPRIDGSRFGVPPDAHPGDRVLHVACGNGALTKMLFSSGLQVGGCRRLWGGRVPSWVGQGFAASTPLVSQPHKVTHVAGSCMTSLQ